MWSGIGSASRWILVGWLGLLVVSAAVFVADVSFSGGWADLVLAVGALLGIVGLAAIAVTWVLVRFVVEDSGFQVLVSLAGPPLLTAVAIALLRVL